MATEVTCTVSPCEVVVQVDSAPLSPERVADMGELWLLIFAAVAVVWGWRKLIALFKAPTHGND